MEQQYFACVGCSLRHLTLWITWRVRGFYLSFLMWKRPSTYKTRSCTPHFLYFLVFCLSFFLKDLHLVPSFVQNISTVPFFSWPVYFDPVVCCGAGFFSKLPSSRAYPNITFAAVVQFSPSLITAICCTCPSFLSALPLPGVPVYSGAVLQVVFCCCQVCCLIDWLLISFFCTLLWLF